MIPIPMLAAVPGWGKWLAAAVLAAALYGAGFVRGIEHEADRHAEEIRQIAVAGAAQEARTEAQIKDQKRITEETRDGYSQALDALHRHYARARGVPGYAAGGGQVSAVPDAAGGVDARPADAGPGSAGAAPAETDVGCVSREAAAATTMMFLWLRDWVERHERMEK